MNRYLILLFVGTVLAGCNADTLPDPTPDYREVFEGRYIGVRTISSWTLNGPYTSVDQDDTVHVVLSGDSALLLNQTEIHIGTDGLFFEQGNAGASSYFSVQFSNGDSLRTDLNGGGLGGGYHNTFRGRKQ